jgi:conflict system pore-forming effector with SLATT domain
VALHQHIQRLLLIGARLDTPPAPPVPEPPPRLRPLIESLAQAHAVFDARAIRFGHRYRSGFWAIYLLSAVAVLCAMMPLALGWDDLSSYMHSYAAGWVIAEILVIAGVASIYWRGQRNDWQGEWLRARTVAELTSYLPLIAPLVDFGKPGAEPGWYARAGLEGQHLPAPAEVSALCQANESRARELLADAWSDPSFVAAYAEWAVGILQSQQAYHARVARRSHVLRHRIHRVTAGLFALTGLAALAHLVIHSRLISLITTVFPALAAALHGAAAQSEAYRLEAASERAAIELQKVAAEIRASLKSEPHTSRNEKFRSSVRDALGLILQEHQDWYMLVRPHHLPLA